MRRHIVGAHGKDLAAELGCKTPTELHHLCTAPDCRDDLARVLAEANDREPHQHESHAKYLLTIKPRKPLAHNHADYVRPDRRQRHIRKHHSGIEVVGAHIHDGAKFDRVTMEDDDPRMSPGRRIDALPLSWELLPRAEVVYFVMEGKIKADAALSCILDLGLAASVVDVPSVGQWEALELDELCNHLTGKTIVIVVDSDADGNDQVMTQGIRLRSLGSSDTACALA